MPDRETAERGPGGDRRAPGGAQRLRAWAGTTRGRAPFLVLLAACIGQAVFLGWLIHDLYFMWADDYDFLLLRGTIDGVDDGWLSPHDDHWSTGTIAIYRALYAVVGMREYLPYGMVTILFHLGIALVLYPLLRKVGVGRWGALVPPLLLVFFGGGSQVIMWNTTMGTAGALFLGYVALLVSAVRGLDPIAVRWVNVILLVGLTMSGVGITAVVLVSAYALLASGWRRALQVTVLPFVVFVAWYIAYGRSGAKPALADGWDYLSIPEFVWEGLVAHVEWLTGIPGSGGVLLLGLVAVVLWAPAELRPARDLGFAGLIACAFQIVLAASTRMTFGLEGFTDSRYAYASVVLLAPAMGVAVAALARVRVTPSWLVPATTVFVLLLVCVNGQRLFKEDQEFRAVVTGTNAGILKAIRAGAQDGQTVLTVTTTDIINLRFRADLVAQENVWDDLPPGEPTFEERLAADNNYFVSVNPVRNGYPTPQGRVRAVGGWEDDGPVREGCERIEATIPGAYLEVPLGEPWTLSIDGPATQFTTAVVREDTVGLSRTWPVTADDKAYVSSTVATGTLQIGVDQPGRYLVCS